MEVEINNQINNLRDTLRLIRMVNRLASIESSVEAFADRVCTILCNKKGYNVVWMALWNKGQFDYFTSSDNRNFDHFVDHNFSNKSVPKCVQQAISTRRPISSDEGLFSCKLCALNQNECGSCGMIFPLRYRNEFLGVIGSLVPSNYSHSTLPEEKNLFEEITADIAFAINKYHLQGVVNDINLTLENTQRILNNQTNSALFVQDQRIIDVNEILLNVTGYDRLSLVGSSISDYFGSSEYIRILREIYKLSFDNYRSKLEVSLRSNSGQLLHFDCYLTRIVLNNRDAFHVKLIDRTHRLGLEKELKISRKRMSVLLSSLPGMAYVSSLDNGWKLYFVSQGSLKLTGYSPSYFEGENGATFSQIMHPDDIPTASKIAYEAISRDEPFELRYRIITKSKEVKWVWEKGQRVVYEDSVSLEGFITDITDLVVSEEHLKKLNYNQSVILDNVPSKICYLDEENIVVHGNESFAQFFNTSLSEIIGKHISDFVGENNSAFVANNREVRESGIPRRGQVEVFSTKEGKSCYLLTDVLPNHVGDNSKGVIVFATDITEMVKANEFRKQKIEELKVATFKAKESDRLKSAFLSTLSHEMRTPMNGILGFASLLKNPRLNEEERSKYARIIKNAGERMLETIDNIVEMSKIKTGIITANCEKVSISPILYTLVEKFQQECTKKGLLFVFDNRLEGCLDTLEVDREKFVAIVSRLLHNSVRFTFDGSVVLRCYSEGSKVFVEVCDTGVGIENEKLKDVFLPFVHAGSKLSDNQEGSGLGLSIAKSYAEMMNGTISVSSKRNKGSCFSVCFPRFDDNNTSTQIESKQLGEAVFQKRVLVLEDDEDSSLYLQYYFEGHSFRVVRTHSLEDLISELEGSVEYDLLFVNPMFNKYDSNEVLGSVKELAPSVPFIVHTTSILEQNQELAQQLGCAALLVKPYPERQLDLALESVFGELLITVGD